MKSARPIQMLDGVWHFIYSLEQAGQRLLRGGDVHCFRSCKNHSDVHAYRSLRV